MGIGGVNGEAKCFEGGSEFIVREVMFKAIAHVASGGIGDGFVEVNDLPGEVVELGTFPVSVGQGLGGVR